MTFHIIYLLKTKTVPDIRKTALSHNQNDIQFVTKFDLFLYHDRHRRIRTEWLVSSKDMSSIQHESSKMLVFDATTHGFLKYTKDNILINKMSFED